MQQLLTANAYLSTLGGGYFMCKQLGNAKVLHPLVLLQHTPFVPFYVDCK